MFVVDTNVLVYAADRQAPEHMICRKLLRAWREEAPAWHLTWGIVYEFLRVATHPKVLRRPMATSEAWRVIASILLSPGLSMLVETERHAAIAADVFAQVPAAQGNMVFDAHIAVLMKEHGVSTICTRDADFHRFSFLRVVDPLDADGL